MQTVIAFTIVFAFVVAIAAIKLITSRGSTNKKDCCK
jgi:hypothetical protein